MPAAITSGNDEIDVMATKRRAYKVGERVQAILARELQKVADPRFSLVTLTSVVVTQDLHYANVYWIASGGTERNAEVSEAFEGASGRFRKVVASELGTRFAPELRFFYDDTLDAVDNIERLLSSINNGKAPE